MIVDRFTLRSPTSPSFVVRDSLNDLQGNLRKMPYQNRIKPHNLKKQKLLSNQIKSLTQNFNTLQNLQGEIVKQQRITNSLNRNVPSDKDVM